MVGYIDGKEVCSDKVSTANTAKKIVITPQNEFVYDSCDDAVIFNISVVDENGVSVPTADNLIKFTADGGEIIGVGNGDPNSHEADKAEERHLFNGLCQVIVKQSDGAENVTVTAASDGLESATATVKSVANENKKIFIPSVNEKYIAKWRQAVDLSETRPDPNVKIEDHDMNTWGIVSVGSGYDDKFKNITGYGLYKTTVNINENDNFIVFRELTGNEVEVFVNGEQKFKGDCQWGRKVEINVSDVNGDADIAVIVNSTKADGNGGISKPVVITD